MSRTWLVLIVSLVSACGPGKGDTTTTEGSTGAAATGTTDSTTDSTAGSTVTPTTGIVTSDGSTTSTTAATTTTMDEPPNPTDGENCPPGYSPGCCFGDGGCCPCVGFDCGFNLGPSPTVDAFQECACQDDECAGACEFACAGDGIDISCFVCAEKAGRTSCAQEFTACGGEFEFTCDPPPDCDSCERCALSGECYDPWIACWFDPACRDLMRECEPSCQDPACLQGCVEKFPAGGALYQAYLDCTYCDTCAAQCGDVGVTCQP